MRVGVLTGGGDCPGLNAAISPVVKAARIECGCDVLGIEYGFKGLVGIARSLGVSLGDAGERR